LAFIHFIDKYYRELSKAKFGPTKEVMTRLTKRILDEVGTPHYGVQGAFQVGNSTQICQQIFWAVLKSHVIMTSYKHLNFKNRPSIATGLVKFQAINTSFKAIKQLTTKTAYLELEIVDFKKQLAAAVKSAVSSATLMFAVSSHVLQKCSALAGCACKMKCLGEQLSFKPCWGQISLILSWYGQIYGTQLDTYSTTVSSHNGLPCHLPIDQQPWACTIACILMI
jgi:hypothetical protein